MTTKAAAFGERLRAERERMGLTQTAFAEMAGVKRTAQHFYETGARSPTVDYLQLVVAAGANLEYLVLGDVGVSGGLHADDVPTAPLAAYALDLAGVRSLISIGPQQMRRRGQAQAFTSLHQWEDVGQEFSESPKKVRASRGRKAKASAVAESLSQFVGDDEQVLVLVLVDAKPSSKPVR